MTQKPDVFFENLSVDLKSLDPTVQLVEDHLRKHETVLHISASKVREIALRLRDVHGFEFLIDITAVDWPERDKRFDIVHIFLNQKSNIRVRTVSRLGDKEKIPSLQPVWKAADWLERETYDMFGIQFDGHHDLRRILCHDEFKGFPLRKDYPPDLYQPLIHQQEHQFEKDRARLMQEAEEDLLWLNIGPAHPATHGTLRMMAVIDGGENVRAMDFEIGYLHRCFEKMCETHNYNQIIPYTDRLNYCSAPLNNNAFALAVEKLLNVQVPPRCQAIRMILDELSRIIDHFVCIGTNAVDLGAITGFFYLFDAREKVYQIFEKLCGARLTVSLTRIGGLGFDLPPGWLDECRQVVDYIEKTHKEVDGLLTNNRIFVQRTKGAGPVSKQMALDYCFSGPCLRASGHEIDVRKLEPYYLYKDVDFDVPVGSNGDTYDRYLVRMEEIRQSMKIIRWCLDHMPEGAISVDNKLVTLPPKKEVYGNIEGLMNHFMLVIHGVKTPPGAIYSGVEAANGELGFYIVSDGSGMPYRVKCRAPCLNILSGFREATLGGKIADAISALGSVNFIAGELDR